MRARSMRAASFGAKSRVWYVCGSNTYFAASVVTASCSAAVKPSGVYGSSAAFSRVTTSCTCAAASSAAGPAVPAPGTTTAIGVPIAFASCCAPTRGSHVARLSLPLFCSALTRILSSPASYHPRVFAMPAHELLCRVRRRARDHVRLLALFRRIEADDRQFRGRRRRGGLPDLLLSRRHDPLEGGVTELVDTALDRQQGRQRHR